MFRIGEFSTLVRVSPRMLRHYEKCGLLYPAEIDRFTGYRQYSARQIPMLARIVALRDVGFSIDEIGDILPHFEDAAYMDRTLMEKSNLIQTTIAGEEAKLAQLKAMRNTLKKEPRMMKYEVILKELPSVKVLALREVISSYDKEGALWEKMGSFMGSNQINCPTCEESGYSIYWDDDYKEEDVDVEIAVPVAAPGKDKDGFVFKELPGIKMAATLRFAGPYEQYAETMETLAEWMEQNGYAFDGPMRGAAIRTAADQSDPNNFLTELQVPVKKI